ncbi:MAG: hypothetical protein SGBAC_006099 [Bacillariaceae sp.]
MKFILLAFATIKAVEAAGHGSSVMPVQLGSRPFYLINEMADSQLKTDLENCAANTEKYAVSHWSIGHRGACLQFPEHTLESYSAALSQGAGIVECDVTFTKDKELVCRHAQCDLHTTTDVVTRSDMNTKCTTPWAPGVAPKCCTSDFTLVEIQTLCAKMDASVADAATAEEYIGGTSDWRTDLYSAGCHKVPTHGESIALIDGADAYFTPELKTPEVPMPFDGFTQEMYAQKMVDEYVAAGVPSEKVWVQSFLWDDVVYWINNAADFGAQAVALEGTYEAYDFNVTALDAHFKPIIDAGANFYAPPTWMLLDNVNNEFAASEFIKYAKDKGFKIITWTLERSGPLFAGGGWYFQSVNGEKDGDQSLIMSDGQVFEFLHAVQTEVGIEGIFSDWPATTTFYANCMNLGMRGSTDVGDNEGGSGSGIGAFHRSWAFAVVSLVALLVA